MTYLAKLAKLARLARTPLFLKSVLRYRVAATTEHLDAIRYCAPVALLDVGANKRQFSLAVRALQRDAVIHAFEPLPAAGDRFAALFSGDSRVQLHRAAICAVDGAATFYVTDRADSSSLLKPGKGQKEAFGVGGIEQMTVAAKPLEALVDLRELPHPLLLKIDVQGAELNVLKGIAHLDEIDFIYVELSFVELYENQALFEDVRA